MAETSTRLRKRQKPTSPFARGLGPKKACTVGASVTADEKIEIELALHQSGFKSASEGARTVLLGWARGELTSRAA